MPPLTTDQLDLTDQDTARQVWALQRAGYRGEASRRLGAGAVR